MYGTLASVATMHGPCLTSLSHNGGRRAEDCIDSLSRRRMIIGVGRNVAMCGGFGAFACEVRELALCGPIHVFVGAVLSAQFVVRFHTCACTH